MKRFFVAAIAATVFPLTSATAQQFQSRETTCNLRYNNRGIISAGVPCQAKFDYRGELAKVSFYYPETRSNYSWSITQRGVSKDPRWKECIRYTFPEGNQWQVCTVPSPDQLKIRTY